MRRFFILLCLLLPLISWLLYAVLERPLSAQIAHHWGTKILQAGDGKFSDAAAFLHHRFFEGTWLLSASIGLFAVAIGLGKLLSLKVPALWRWVPYSVTAFAALNIWIRFAMATCLFWCLFWNGKGTTDNLTQFHIKRLSMDENRAPVTVVLAGSSQVRTEIDKRLLNQALGSNYFVTELHFPGNRAYDFLLLHRELFAHRADILVCYLSELNFYDGGISDGFSYFFACRDLPEFLRLGGKPNWSLRRIAYGILGDLLPVFRLRDVVAKRVLGSSLTELKQADQTGSLSLNLRQRALQAAPGYRDDAQSQFSFASFEAFVSRCRAEKRTVVLCPGQLNPILAREFNPALRPRMLAFLRQLAANYENVVLIAENDLPRHPEADYEDLTHVNASAQDRFTTALASVLQRLNFAQSPGY